MVDTPKNTKPADVSFTFSDTGEIIPTASPNLPSFIEEVDATVIPSGLDAIYEGVDGTVATASPDIDGLIEVDNDQDGVPDADVVIAGQRLKPVEDRADHRVRLSAFRNQELVVYGAANKTANILFPLHATSGLLFPYTPTIAVSQDTTWAAADLENANYDILSFQRASSASISVTGKFTVQNQREGLYLLAAIHFLRTVSKAYFGAEDMTQFSPPTTQTDDATAQADPEREIGYAQAEGKAGLPPPVLLFSGYGNMMFNDLRVVVKSHSWTYEESADLVPIEFDFMGGKSKVWLPPMMTITIQLALQQNTDKLRREFNLDKFRTGELLNKRGWF